MSGIRMAMFVLAGMLVSSLTWGQSLADVAKKEKERREKNGEEASEVIDTDALNGAGATDASTTVRIEGKDDADMDTDSVASSSSPDGGRDTGADAGRSASPRFMACVGEVNMADYRKQQAQRSFDRGFTVNTSSYRVRADSKRYACDDIITRRNSTGFSYYVDRCRGYKDEVQAQEKVKKTTVNQCMQIAREEGLSPGEARQHLR